MLTPPPDAAMTLLPSPTELALISSLGDVVTFVGLRAEPWAAVNAALGNAQTTRVLAGLPPAAVRAVVTSTIVPPTDDGVGRGLTPVEVAQVGLAYRIARARHGLADLDPLVTDTPAAAPTTFAKGAPSVPPSSLRKIKMNQVLDQADEAEINPLGASTLDAMHRTLYNLKGGPTLPEHEPSDDQMCALRTRVLDLQLSPYADFALFTPFHLRHLKNLKFANHVLQPDGTFKTVEVPGPPNFDSWYASWRVFESTLLMLTTVDAAGNACPVVSPASLDAYRESFRLLVSQYPECWHLCVTTEDRCRAEHFPRLKRDGLRRFHQGLEPEFKVHAPWDWVFRHAAEDVNYWNRYVKEPALVFLATGGRRGHKVDLTGPSTDRTGGNSGGGGFETPVKRRKSTHDKLKQLRAELAETKSSPSQGSQQAPSPPPSTKGGGKGAKKGKGGKRGKEAQFHVDRDGNEICYNYNNGSCKRVCPAGRMHVCQICLGNHPRTQCKKGRNM